VFFPSGSTSLSSQAQQRLRQFLQDCPYIKPLEKGTSLVVQGHTDTTGDEQANKILSMERARAVRRYLISLGVSPALVEVEGLGDSKLLAVKGDDETTHAQNRRAEVFVRKNGEIVVIW
jgi:OOP family OmpA-OmpF porin